MKEVKFENGLIVSKEGSLCAYGDRQCGISCPHFEFVDGVKYPQGTVGEGKYMKDALPKIIITCSGFPVTLKVKE